MINNNGSDEETEQGFAPSQIVINHNQQLQPEEQQIISKSKFQTKALANYLILRLQPQEVYATNLKCQLHPLQTIQAHPANKTINHKKPMDKITIYEKYQNNSQYSLVYRRGNSIPNQQQQINNDISLKDACNKQNQYYRKLKRSQKIVEVVKNDELLLDSKFEGGNLYCAYRLSGTHEYHLIMQYDSNSRGYTQWFYYSVDNAQVGVKYTFHIVNFKKKYSFFKNGCKPVSFSVREAKKSGRGWYRIGQNIIYEENELMNNIQLQDKFYTLTFQMQIYHPNDHILIALTIPYSYSRMLHQLMLHQQIANQNPNIRWSTESICQTVCGNDVPQLTITSVNNTSTNMIIFICRAHPSQTWSSYMLEGIMNSITEYNLQVEWLLNNCTIKIYPMINIDGVIYGNSRCDITGVDMNRRWKDPSKILHPQIYHIKNRIKQYKKQYKIQCCFDLHGHSKQYGIFSYGCKDNIESCRILPYLLQNENRLFKLNNCTFGISQCKRTTARANIYKIIKNQNVITIETSLYGAKNNDNTVQIFQPSHLYSMANSLIVVIRHFMDAKSHKLAAAQVQVHNNIKEIINQQKLAQSDSDSDPSADQIDFQQKMKNILPKSLQSQSKSFKKDISYHQAKEKEDTNSYQNIRKHPISKPNEQKSSNLIHSIQHKNKDKNYQNVKKITSFRTKHYISPNNKYTNKTIENQSFKRPKKVFKDIDKVSIECTSQERYSNLSKQPQGCLSSTLQNPIQSLQSYNELSRKFGGLFPRAYLHKPYINLEMLQQSQQNNSQIDKLQQLIQMKKKMQLQRIKKNIELSTSLVERQGKIRINSRRKKQEIIDFRKFKNNAKIKAQIKQPNQINTRFADRLSQY